MKEETIKEIQKMIDTSLEKMTKSSSEEHGESKKGHESYSEAVDCPDCFPQIAKALWDKRKGLEYECAGCGFPVKEEETCPACGKKESYIR